MLTVATIDVQEGGNERYISKHEKVASIKYKPTFITFTINVTQQSSKRLSINYVHLVGRGNSG